MKRKKTNFLERKNLKFYGSTVVDLEKIGSEGMNYYRGCRNYYLKTLLINGEAFLDFTEQNINHAEPEKKMLNLMNLFFENLVLILNKSQAQHCLFFVPAKTGKLWSNIKEILKMLGIPFVVSKKDITNTMAAYKLELEDVYFHKTELYTDNISALQLLKNDNLIYLFKEKNKINAYDLHKYKSEYPFDLKYFHLLYPITDLVNDYSTKEINMACEAFLQKKDVSNNIKLHKITELLKENQNIILPNIIEYRELEEYHVDLSPINNNIINTENVEALAAKVKSGLSFKELEEESFQFNLMKEISLELNLPPIQVSGTSTKEMRELIESNFPGVTVVNDKESAMRVINILNRHTDRPHACDSETIDIDVKRQSPVVAGTLISFSIYIGPDVDFGNGPRIYVDNLDISFGTLDYFKEYFENANIKKIWHNYGFDRHIFFRHGIDCQGFDSDTMHLARLYDSSRLVNGGYSLSALSSSLLSLQESKEGMKSKFGFRRTKKDGDLAKESVLPPLDVIQRDPEQILSWIDYCTLDSEATWFLRYFLKLQLMKMNWHKLEDKPDSDMWEFYKEHWRPFGVILTDMERAGIHVDIPYLKTLLERANEDKERLLKKYSDWVMKIDPAYKDINPNSTTQKQQLLFGPRLEIEGFKLLPERTFLVPNTDGYIEPGKNRALKNKKLVIRGLGLEVVSTTKTGLPEAGAPVLNKLAGKAPDYGLAKEQLDKLGLDGAEGCEALAALSQANAVDTLISNFLIPLIASVDERDRIHCGLNINTETGRLSARKPNLQNQPALDKDIYKIRAAFKAEPGNTFIVSDYGQLELRLLAHVTKCRSMIDAFESGGDFHSRTAIGMYDEIQEKVDKGEVLLEWDDSNGPAPVPLIKDVFGTQRRRAKTVNFSIAYGKTVFGFAKDWNITPEEAQKILDKWYADRPEVKEWQEKVQKRALEKEVTYTLFGRYRRLPGIKTPQLANHLKRASINTPLQGGAADIMVACMNNLHKNKRLRDLGWKQLLQIHDELIFEGPKETAEEAAQIVKQEMEHPTETKLEIELKVDYNIADNWYEAK